MQVKTPASACADGGLKLLEMEDLQRKKTLEKGVGVVAGVVGMIDAGLDMNKNGATVQNVTQMALGAISVGISFCNPASAVISAISLTVTAASIVNDVISVARKTEFN